MKTTSPEIGRSAIGTIVQAMGITSASGARTGRVKKAEDDFFCDIID